MFGLLLAALVEFTAADARIAYDATVDFVRECTPRDAGTVRGRLAANWILGHVSRCGADASIDAFEAEVPDGTAHFANVTVAFPAADSAAPWYVFISHFDTTPNGGAGFQGANDGASTTGLLIALAGAIRRAGKPTGNVMLAWTDAEEARTVYSTRDGLQGAKRLLAQFRAKDRRIAAVIGLDMLGDRDLGITIPLNGTPELRKTVHAAAAHAGLADLVRDSRDVVRDDFAVFHDAGVPAVNLIDFEYGSAPGLNDYWHTPQDTTDKISEASLHKSGRLAVAILNMLEGARK